MPALMRLPIRVRRCRGAQARPAASVGPNEGPQQRLTLMGTRIRAGMSGAEATISPQVAQNFSQVGWGMTGTRGSSVPFFLGWKLIDKWYPPSGQMFPPCRWR